jgi:hypothetical protein
MVGRRGCVMSKRVVTQNETMTYRPVRADPRAELERDLGDPAFRAEWEAIADEFAALDTLLEARRRAGLTQEQVAERMGGEAVRAGAYRDLHHLAQTCPLPDHAAQVRGRAGLQAGDPVGPPVTSPLPPGEGPGVRGNRHKAWETCRHSAPTGRPSQLASNRRDEDAGLLDHPPRLVRPDDL